MCFYNTNNFQRYREKLRACKEKCHVKISLLHITFPSYIYLNICLSETFLDPSFTNDNPRLKLTSCKLVRVNNMSNDKRSGIGIYLFYFKETFAMRSDLVHN